MQIDGMAKTIEAKTAFSNLSKDIYRGKLLYNATKSEQLDAALLFHLQEYKLLFVTCFIAYLQNKRTINQRIYI